MNNFRTFYSILEESLKGKRVKLRHYENDGYKCYTHKDEEIIGWNDELTYNEWTGTVSEILQNDNSHVDIIFDENLPRTKSNPALYDDCFNWHMGDYIEILND